MQKARETLQSLLLYLLLAFFIFRVKIFIANDEMKRCRRSCVYADDDDEIFDNKKSLLSTNGKFLFLPSAITFKKKLERRFGISLT